MAIITAPVAFTGLGGPTAASAKAALLADTSLTRHFRCRTGDINTAGSAATFTGSISSNNLTVQTAPTSGALAVGSIISGAGVPDGVSIVSLNSGTGQAAGSVWNLSAAVSSAIATEAMTALPGVDSMIDLKGSGALLQADTNRRPSLQAGVMQGYSLAQQALAAPALSAAQFEAAYFAATSIDGMALTGAQPDPTAAYSFAFIFKPSGALADEYVGGLQTGASARAILQGQSSSGKLLWDYDNSGVAVSGGIVDGSTWNVAIISYDGAGNFYFRTNGVTQTLSAAGAQAAIANPFRIGSISSGSTGIAAFKGWFRDILLFNVNLLDGATAHTTTLAKLQAYCSKVYGLTA